MFRLQQLINNSIFVIIHALLFYIVCQCLHLIVINNIWQIVLILLSIIADTIIIALSVIMLCIYTVCYIAELYNNHADRSAKLIIFSSFFTNFITCSGQYITSYQRSNFVFTINITSIIATDDR